MEPAASPVSLESPAATTKSSARFWAGVLVAAIVASPLAWLLSYAASLPFFIGLFFFALFGLIIGAICFRVASRTAPHRGSAVLAGTTILVLGTWCASIVFEARSFPEEMAHEALIHPKADLKGQEPAAFKAAVRGEVQQFLSRRYPPGGTLGYVRWAMADGVIADGELASVGRGLRMNQTGYWWIGRAAVSVALLAFGIASQTLGLRTFNTPSS